MLYIKCTKTTYFLKYYFKTTFSSIVVLYIYIYICLILFGFWKFLIRPTFVLRYIILQHLTFLRPLIPKINTLIFMYVWTFFSSVTLRMFALFWKTKVGIMHRHGEHLRRVPEKGQLELYKGEKSVQKCQRYSFCFAQLYNSRLA